jgi:hypothetical protein
MGYTALVHKEGPDKQVFESGAVNELKSGSILDIHDGALVEVNDYHTPAKVTFAFAAGAANVSECTIAVLDGAGVAVTTPQILTMLLSDAATGLAVTSHAADTLAAKAASGSIINALVAGKCHMVQTLANGSYVAEITDTHKTAFYVTAYLPVIGKTFVSRVMVAGDYGA